MALTFHKPSPRRASQGYSPSFCRNNDVFVALLLSAIASTMEDRQSVSAVGGEARAKQRQTGKAPADLAELRRKAEATADRAAAKAEAAAAKAEAAAAKAAAKAEATANKAAAKAGNLVRSASSPAFKVAPEPVAAQEDPHLRHAKTALAELQGEEEKADAKKACPH